MKRTVKRILSLLFAVTLLTAAACPTALAAKKSGKCGDNVTWTYDSKKKTLTFSGKGAFYPEDNDGYNAAVGSNSVSVVIKKGITKICTGSFGNLKIKKLSLPSSLKEIEGGSILVTGSGTLPSTVTIPKSVTTIGITVFREYGKKQKLKTIKVEKGNKNFVAVKGVLYTKKKTTLIACPCGKTGKFTIPDSVKYIGPAAFNHSSLTRLIVPESVTQVHQSTFKFSPFKELLFLGKVPRNLEIDGNVYAENVFYREKYSSYWEPFKSECIANGFTGKWWEIYKGKLA